jgi:hypothetical protein
VAKPLLLEHGRTLMLPPIEAEGLRAVAATFRSRKDEESGACGPTVEWRADGGPWTRTGVGLAGPWSHVEVRLTAACDPVPLGGAFESTFRNTWVRTAPPERQHVPFVFRGPDGSEREVPARYAGDYRWTVHFEPDEPGRWTYAWGETFTTDPYRSATGTFDVLVDPANLDALLARLAEDAHAWDRKADPRAAGQVLSNAPWPGWERAGGRRGGDQRERVPPGDGGGRPLRRRLKRGPGGAWTPRVPDVLPMKPDKPPEWKRAALPLDGREGAGRSSSPRPSPPGRGRNPPRSRGRGTTAPSGTGARGGSCGRFAAGQVLPPTSRSMAERRKIPAPPPGGCQRRRSRIIPAHAPRNHSASGKPKPLLLAPEEVAGKVALPHGAGDVLDLSVPSPASAEGRRMA